MTSKFAKNNATKGFSLPFIMGFLEGGRDFDYMGTMLIFSSIFGAIIGLVSGLLENIQEVSSQGIIEEFIVAHNEWSIIEQ